MSVVLSCLLCRRDGWGVATIALLRRGRSLRQFVFRSVLRRGRVGPCCGPLFGPRPRSPAVPRSGFMGNILQMLPNAKVAANVGPSWELGRAVLRGRLIIGCECIQWPYEACGPVLGGPCKDYGTEVWQLMRTDVAVEKINQISKT